MTTQADPPAVHVVDLSGTVPGSGDVAGASSIGPVRSENQDILSAFALDRGAGLALLVADGMGGMAGGGEAAREARDAVMASLTAGGGGRAGATAAMHFANDAVGALRDRMKGHPGTTLTIALVEPGFAIVAHAGDSRAYLVRGGAATVLTSDHSWVGDQIRAGELEPGAERLNPRRNMITMAVMGEALTPELIDVHLDPGDLLVLCSDGFWEPLSDADIAELFITPGPLTAVVERAVQAALVAGGTDNVTVLALRTP